MAYPRGSVRWVGLNVKALDGSGRLVQPFHSWMPIPPSVRVHPAPIYETILYLGVFVALWALREKIRVRGRIFYLYLILAGASRFMVEFIRTNPRGAWGLTEPQLIAFAMAAIGLAAYLASGVMEPQTVGDNFLLQGEPEPGRQFPSGPGFSERAS
jgi:prolipoprotein diacylglyceryltransferase